MNKQRKKELDRIQEILFNTYWKMEELLEKEQEAINNLPKNIQWSDYGTDKQMLHDELEEIKDKIESVANELEEKLNEIEAPF